MAYVSAKKYKWEDPEVEKFIKQRTSNPNASYYPKGELVITRDYLKGGNNSRLAWKFSISSLVPNNEQWIYVDAQTGETIRKTPRIYDANIPCTAETLYSGTLSITGDSFTGGYRLRENRNGVNVLTLNLQHTYDFANAIDLVNSNTNFTSSGWPSFSVDRPALDAHLGAESVLDYWRTVHGRNSIDGNGMAVNSGVHFGSGVANAFWDDNANVMYYGDGDGILFKPLTTLDVCGHEIGHGITQYTSNLQYIFSQESSALNEGFSDIWGACVEHVAAPNKQMWLLGEEIFISTYNAIRNLQNPRASNLYEGPHPDTYQGDYWDFYNDYFGEPHNNSTVLSHWFYLLCTGGSGWNNGHTSHASSGDGYFWTVNGVGINNAERIAYRTALLYLVPTANYVATRSATIQAAIDLFGTNSCQEKSVRDAWNAVGIGSSYFGGPLSMSGDDRLCDIVSNPYIINNLSSGVPVQWQATPSGIVTINSPNSQQTTLTKNTNGRITLTATIPNPCGGAPVILTKEITVGTPSFIGTSFFSGTSSTLSTWNSFGGTGEAFVQLDGSWGGYTSYNWTLYSGTVSWYNQYYMTPPGIKLYFDIGRNQPYGKQVAFRLSAVNGCGTLNEVYYFYYTGINGYSIVASPNPTTGDVEITSMSTSTNIKEIRVTDKTGVVKKQFSFNSNSKSVTINISSLPADVYYLQVYDGKEWVSKPIIKK